MPPVNALARERRSYELRIRVAIVAAVALLALGLLAAVDLLLPLPRAVRICVALAGAITVVTSIVLARRTAQRRHTPRTVAEAIEAARPELGQKIRTAVEVVQRGSREMEPEAQFFATRLIAQSEAAVAADSWRSLIPRARWVVALLAAVGAAVIIVFAATRSADFRLALTRFLSPVSARTYSDVQWSVAPRVFDERHPPRLELRVDGRVAEPVLFLRERGGAWTQTPMTPLPDGRSWDIVLTGKSADLELYATAGDGRTALHTLAFKPIPKLTAVRTHLTFPDYTGRPPVTRQAGDVSAVEGAKVRWEFTFNVVPDGVTWQVGTDPGQRLVVDPANKVATAEWAAGTARLNAAVSVVDDVGEVIDSWRFVAEGFADAMPSVEILEPTKDTEATSITELPVRIRAKDDFGVSEVGLVLEAAGERDWVLEKVISERDQRTVSEIAAAMLEKVPLTITDNVRLYAYALDHKPRGGPRSVSPLRSIDIREFKKRWMFRESDGGFGGGGGGRQQVLQRITNINQIIKPQRVIVSDVFLLRESIRAAGTAVTASAMPIGKRETELAVKGTELHTEWFDKGAPADDLTLLDTATAQMQEASMSLGLKGPANLDKGFTTADRALTTLLQLRKRLLTILQRGSAGEGEEPKPEDQIRPLADLAKEAERLAREERDIDEQLAPEAASGTNIEATRRQHDIVVNDAGELYAAIVDHPQTSEFAISLMGDAEKAIRAADEALRGAESRASRPQLKIAERRLLELAEFLHAMELTQVNQTLRKLANNAEQGAKSVRESKDAPAAGSEQNKSGGAQEGSAGQASAGQAPAGQSSGEGKLQKSDASEPIRQASRDSARADQTLNALAEKAGGRSQNADTEDPATGKALGETLAELREQVGGAKLAQELAALADRKPGPGDEPGTKEAATAAAGKLDRMAGEFRDAAARLEATRAANLAAAQAQARELQRQLAAAAGAADGANAGKSPGQDGKGREAKPPAIPGLGNSPGAGQNKQASNQPGKDGQQPGKDGQGKPGNAPGQQPGSKPGAEAGAKPGEQAGTKPGEAGKAGPGDKPQDSKEGGRGGIAGDIENAQDGPGGQAMGRFSKSLRSVGDDKLNNFAIKLFNAPISIDSLPLVEGAAARIQELIAELPVSNAPLAASGRPPDSRRREVEDYFRSLSDDFAGEQWEAPKKPGRVIEE